MKPNFMKNRLVFTELSRKNFMEFSTLRRVQFSTLVLISQIMRDIDGFQFYTHTLQCRDTQCEISLCTMLKHGVLHERSCTVKVVNGCLICKKVVSICCYHAKYCEDEKCLVPFCAAIKSKLRERRVSERYSHQLFISLYITNKFNFFILQKSHIQHWPSSCWCVLQGERIITSCTCKYFPNNFSLEQNNIVSFFSIKIESSR